MDNPFLWGVAAAVIAVLAVVSAITIGTIKSNDSYYNFAQECVRSGGSWIPHDYGTCLVGLEKRP